MNRDVEGLKVTDREVTEYVFISFCVFQAGKGDPHVFKEKTFKKKRQCGVCRQSVDNLGSFCRGEPHFNPHENQDTWNTVHAMLVH